MCNNYLTLKPELHVNGWRTPTIIYKYTVFVKLGRNICTHKLTLSFVYRSERCVTIDNTNGFKLNITTRTKK